MGVSLKGLTAKGLSLKGREFLLPTDIANLRNWWQWKTGITVDGSNNVSSWADSGGSDNVSLSQTSATRRPAYDAATGKITPDGSNDYLETGTLATIGAISFEFTLVADGRPSVGQWPISRARNTNADTDAIFLQVTSSGVMRKQVEAGGGFIVQSIPGVVPASVKNVLSFQVARSFFVNGVETPYAIRSATATHADTSTPRITLFAQSRNSGGVPTTPIGGFTNLPIYELCIHAKAFTSLERAKLVNYFKIKHGIA